MQQADLLSNELILSSVSRVYLLETAKWAKFLSILGFVGCGFMAIAAFSLPFLMNIMPGNELMPMGGAMLKGMGAMLTIIYLGFAVLLLMPCLYLYRFSVKMKSALIQSETGILDASFANLKSFFKFYGIMMIVILSFYVLLFILALIGGTIFSSMN